MVPIDKAELRRLFLDLIHATVTTLENRGRWPPPPGLPVEFGTTVSLWDVYELPQLDRLKSFLASNEFVTKHYYADYSEMWRQLLLTSLNAARSEGGIKRYFARLFNSYFDELVRTEGAWEYVGTITGLTCEVGFRLDRQTVVKPLTRWHRNPEVAGNYVAFEALQQPTEDDKLAIIFTTRDTKKPGGPHLMNLASPRVSAFLTTCRLLKPGDIRTHCFADGQRSRFPFKESLGVCMDNGRFGHNDVAGVLERRDTRALRRLWQSLRPYHEAWRTRFATRTRLQEALSRFGRTYERQAWVDDIVDLTISVESLLSPTDQQELSYRVATRAAHLLGRLGEPSLETYRVVRTMYKIRSDTVHGTPISGEDELAKWLAKLSGLDYKFETGISHLFSPATEAARNVVRRLILGCARLKGMPANGPTWPLPADFDEQMLDRTSRRRWQLEFQAPRFDVDFLT